MRFVFESVDDLLKPLEVAAKATEPHAKPSDDVKERLRPWVRVTAVAVEVFSNCRFARAKIGRIATVSKGEARAPLPWLLAALRAPGDRGRMEISGAGSKSDGFRIELADGTVFTFDGLDAPNLLPEAPEIPDEAESVSIRCTVHTLQQALSICRPSIACYDHEISIRPGLESVLVSVSKGLISFASTDAHRFTKVDFETEPLDPACETSEGRAFQLEGHICRALAGNLHEKDSILDGFPPDSEVVIFRKAEDSLEVTTFIQFAGLLIGGHVDGSFPDTAKVLTAVEGVDRRIVLDRLQFQAAVKRAISVQTWKRRGVRLKPGTTRLILEAHNDVDGEQCVATWCPAEELPAGDFFTCLNGSYLLDFFDFSWLSGKVSLFVGKTPEDVVVLEPVAAPNEERGRAMVRHLIMPIRVS